MTTSVASHLDKTALNFVERTHKMLINGQWVGAASGMTFPTYNPATGQVLSHAAEGDKADVDAAVRAAREAFDHGPWRKFTASERGRMIWKLADLLEQHTEEFATLESLDNGKPLAVARVADLPLAVDLLRYMAGWTTKIEGNTTVSDSTTKAYFDGSRSVACSAATDCSTNEACAAACNAASK